MNLIKKIINKLASGESQDSLDHCLEVCLDMVMAIPVMKKLFLKEGKMYNYN